MGDGPMAAMGAAICRFADGLFGDVASFSAIGHGLWAVFQYMMMLFGIAMIVAGVAGTIANALKIVSITEFIGSRGGSNPAGDAMLEMAKGNGILLILLGLACTVLHTYLGGAFAVLVRGLMIAVGMALGAPSDACPPLIAQ